MMAIPVGTKSLLYGVYQFALHPFFVALAWRQIYGRWPRSAAVWGLFALYHSRSLARLDGAQPVPAEMMQAPEGRS